MEGADGARDARGLAQGRLVRACGARDAGGYAGRRLVGARGAIEARGGNEEILEQASGAGGEGKGAVPRPPAQCQRAAEKKTGGSVDRGKQ